MGTRIQAELAGVSLACLLTAGCVTERYQPAASLPASFRSENPCAALDQVRNIRPSYPRAAAAHEQQGWVALKYHVAASGEVFNVRVVASSPQGLFDDASAAALARWRYEPMRYPIGNCTHVYVYTLGTERASTPGNETGSFAAFEAIPARE
jgi:TonB family protein